MNTQLNPPSNIIDYPCPRCGGVLQISTVDVDRPILCHYCKHDLTNDKTLARRISLLRYMTDPIQ